MKGDSSSAAAEEADYEYSTRIFSCAYMFIAIID